MLSDKRTYVMIFYNKNGPGAGIVFIRVSLRISSGFLRGKHFCYFQKGVTGMAKRIVEGLWDCSYCQTKAIGGLTKICPCCGHPQDKDIRFYMGNKKRYLEADLAAQYGQGPDWVCPYCGSLNRIRYKFCSGCGAPKDSAEDDYFTNTSRADAAQKPGTEAGAAPAETRHMDRVTSGNKGPKGRSGDSRDMKTESGKRFRISIKTIIFAILALVMLVFLVDTFLPRKYSADVQYSLWVRKVYIEEWRTVQESDWGVPEGGRVYDERSEIHHYDQVLDHYETRTRTVSESVYDGEDTHTSYVNNGDGTFTEETWSTPRYRTEYYTENYEEPVYRDEPVYRTKYYYEIEKWVENREEISQGINDTPYWPEYTLADNERTGYTGEIYGLSLKASKEKTYLAYLPQEQWETFEAGDQVEIKVVGDEVKEINGLETEDRG